MLANIPLTATDEVEIVLKVVGVIVDITSYIKYADVASWKNKAETVSLLIPSS